ncbi:Gfo/Idh/MocA family oxidoreductase [Jeotgalibacillus sp. ET6]|uniref:Gfo/Idh/MocA family protein n=1 Tax=Jeotgalibacillus sp. ET6 TaxID=3037260 RepID=UPI002418427F|nr:Gfo/Idh/MocA family oxidoreductase [Jeotgalibacillus sp. ET6]MDG5472515.1 Gfo/Idh/MocA family oxidoreductase [Jeotgalibacillus sp. ET6]
MSKHKIVIAGCGGMAGTWASYALQRKDAEVAALVDIHKEAAEKFAVTYQLEVPIFRDVGEAVRSTQANLVFDTTIPSVHKSITMAAFEAGCDVMGEKPMSESLEDAIKMTEAAELSGRFYAVMQNRRYLKQIRALRHLIDQGVIGKVGMVSADFYIGAHFDGFRTAMKSPLILDMAIHTFDQARFIMQAEPVSVYCHEFNPAGSWYEGNAAAICIFEMFDGTVFSYRGSWCAEGVQTSWESEWRVNGTDGTAIWDGKDNPYCEVIQQSGQPVFQHAVARVDSEVPEMENEGHYGCLDAMFLALNQGKRAETDCRSNLNSMKMVFGAIESAAKGQKVWLT